MQEVHFTVGNEETSSRISAKIEFTDTRSFILIPGSERNLGCVTTPHTEGMLNLLLSGLVPKPSPSRSGG